MFSRSDALDIECDAPPYKVVRACDRLGFQSPLDVRWSRRSRFVHETRSAWDHFPWSFIFGTRHTDTCSCGHALPAIDAYAFTFVSEKVANYLLGQCPRCRTMFWDEG
jgi:hypothetical protein